MRTSLSSATPAQSPLPDTGDIIVTAQRREERLQDVPISITAITATQLTSSGIDATDQIALVTPGLLLPKTGTATQPFIRGIGNTLSAGGSDNSVAIYVDGVYRPQQASLAFELNNIERVEVLKGPQGTLFGRNAAGGAILIKTYDPTFDPDAQVSARYGRFNDVKLNADLNMPIVDGQVAANVSMLYRHQDSYAVNDITGDKLRPFQEYGGQAKLRADPTSTLSFIAEIGYNNVRDDRLNGATAIDGNTTQNILNPALPLATRPYHFTLNETPQVAYHLFDTSLHGKWETPAGTVSAITSYINALLMTHSDQDFSPAASIFGQLHDRQRTFAQELNFASTKMGAFSLTTGLFYYKDRAHRIQYLSVSSARAPYRNLSARLDTTAYAAFAELNVDLTDRLHAIAGLRYSAEKKEASAVQTGTVSASLAPVHKTFHAYTPRGSLRYDLSPSSNIYFTYSRGFKSGTFNYTALSGDPVQPEKVDAYEVGFKGGKGGLRYNAAAYYYNYKDLQVQSLANFPNFTLQNAATARIYGGEAELHWKATPNWQFDLGTAYTHARYRRFPNALFLPRGPNGINQNLVADASGFHLIRTPTFSANATATYTRDVSVGQLGASLTGNYTGRFYWTTDNRIREPGWFKLNGELSLTFDHRRYRVALWGHNLTNVHNRISVSQASFGDVAIFDEPVTYGISLGAHF